MIYNLGRILPVFRGTWNVAAVYEVMDVVYYNGSSYVAKSNNTNKLPTNTTYWQIIALKGELSGTLTPEQTTAIINQIMNEGVVIDESYTHTDNNFNDTYQSMLDNLNIGNGTITVKKNNTAVGSFTANQSANSDINITVPVSVGDLQGASILQLIPEVVVNDSDTVFDLPILQSNTYYFSHCQWIHLILIVWIMI